MTSIVDKITDNFLLSTLYDIAKYTIGYLLARGLVDGVYMRWKWGNWQVQVQKNGELLTSRELSPAKTKMILNDASDLSVYIKGIVSPHTWLNIDICSQEAKDSGLFVIDRQGRRFIVDVAKNPPAKKK